MEIIDKLSYNSVVILSFFFISLIVFILDKIFKGKLTKNIFSSWHSSLLNPLTYIRLFTHILGHSDWQHFMNNFLYILLIGPMVEEKYGSVNLLIMILIVAFVTGLINSLLYDNKRILGASGIVFMLIILSSVVNITTGKIPITLILIFLFYIVNEITSGLFKKDNISHLSHLLGALMGIIFAFYFKI